jgi:hypothetical protein
LQRLLLRLLLRAQVVRAAVGIEVPVDVDVRVDAKLALIERPSSEHFRWPELDVDLELDSILHPERYPLVFWPDPPEE